MKYGKEDYEELLDTAVGFMKRHALYEEYWGSDTKKERWDIRGKRQRYGKQQGGAEDALAGKERTSGQQMSRERRQNDSRGTTVSGRM